MKLCPTCSSQYSDDTLQFCLQDGTPLKGGSAGETPTVVLTETETVAARDYRKSGGDGKATAWPDSEVTRVGTAPVKTGSNAPVIIAVAAVVLLLVGGLAAAGIWTFIKNSRGSIATNTGSNSSFSTPAINSGYPSSPSPTQTQSPSPTSTPVSTPQANIFTATPVDEAQVRSDVSQRVTAWKSSLESRDFNGYMGNYADTVDYYNRRGVGVGAIRTDKARAFSLYSSMRVTVSDLSVTVGPTGETATSTFDKEWVFDGNDRSEGKTRSQLEFRRINGRWLITAERDLKLYYKR